MFKILRLVLIITVLLAGYTAVLLALVIPYLWMAFVAILVVIACKKTRHWTSYGTARWAEANDLKGMTDE